MIVASMPYAYDTAKSADPAGTSLPAAANKADARSAAAASTTVTISSAAQQLNLNEKLELPNPATIRRLSQTLAGSLNGLLVSAGIRTDPAVSFEVDPNTAHVTVKGNRPDILQIEALVNASKSVQRLMHDITALSGHAVAIAESLKFSADYAAAGSKAEIDAVLTKYADLVGGQQRFAAITLGFDGKGIQLNADGTPWPAATA